MSSWGKMTPTCIFSTLLLADYGALYAVFGLTLPGRDRRAATQLRRSFRSHAPDDGLTPIQAPPSHARGTETLFVRTSGKYHDRQGHLELYPRISFTRHGQVESRITVNGRRRTCKVGSLDNVGLRSAGKRRASLAQQFEPAASGSCSGAARRCQPFGTPLCRRFMFGTRDRKRGRRPGTGIRRRSIRTAVSSRDATQAWRLGRLSNQLVPWTPSIPWSSSMRRRVRVEGDVGKQVAACSGTCSTIGRHGARLSFVIRY